MPGLEVALQPMMRPVLQRGVIRLVPLVRQEEFDSFLQFLPYFFTRNNASFYLTKASNSTLPAKNALSQHWLRRCLSGQKSERLKPLFQQQLPTIDYPAAYVSGCRYQAGSWRIIKIDIKLAFAEKFFQFCNKIIFMPPQRGSVDYYIRFFNCLLKVFLIPWQSF